MEWVASTLHTTSELCVANITTITTITTAAAAATTTTEINLRAT